MRTTVFVSAFAIVILVVGALFGWMEWHRHVALEQHRAAIIAARASVAKKIDEENREDVAAVAALDQVRTDFSQASDTETQGDTASQRRHAIGISSDPNSDAMLTQAKIEQEAVTKLADSSEKLSSDLQAVSAAYTSLLGVDATKQLDVDIASETQAYRAYLDHWGRAASSVVDTLTETTEGRLKLARFRGEFLVRHHAA